MNSIKTWAIAIIFVALVLSSATSYNLTTSYEATIDKYDVVLDEMMLKMTEQDRDIKQYILNERMLLEEVGGISDALEYMLDQCAAPAVEETL